MNFQTLYSKSLDIGLGLNLLLQKGNLVYEYNPLRVLRVNEDTTIDNQFFPKGSIINLDTDLLNFDLKHPVEINTLQSYDGSVNLIINDGYNYPKLINTRFSSTGLDTYQIVDREGDNDTNIYDVDTFESDISLYKKINNIVKLNFIGIKSEGNLKVGNYVFYFKLCDSDGNETDFIAESGIVTCHIGNLNDPFSILGGIRDQNSYKSVHFIMSNIDSSYNNIIVYYTRSTADIDGNEITTSFKINKTYSIYNNTSNIVITGFEDIQQVSLNDINVAYNIVDKVTSAASCQNMLFLGNVHKQDINYKELQDLSLRFTLHLNDSNNIGYVDENYNDASNLYEYYNVNNIYYKLGYWNNEIYRFGIVYILNDYTLSPVFNIRGINELSKDTVYTDYPVYLGDTRNYININQENYTLDNLNENAKGVIKINYLGNQLSSLGIIPLGFDLKVSEEVILELKKYTKGYFLVRLKRIPTTLCLAATIGLESVSHLPTIPTENGYLMERFIDDDRLLTHNFSRRIVYIKPDRINVGSAAICPEYELRLSYFNTLFTSALFMVLPTYKMNNSYNSKGTYFYNLDYTKDNNSEISNFIITAVGDNTKLIRGKNSLFSSRAGEAEEAYRLSYYDYQNKSSDATNIIRGSFGPYIGLEGYNINSLSIIDIKIPNYDELLLDQYFSIRYNDSSAFYAITDRYSWDDYELENIFRGDCFIGNYTHRMIRNFQDPSAPINDDIVDELSWKDNYKINDSESNAEINRGDVNAIKLGHWITIKICSNVNISMRSLDVSYPSELGLTGKARGFYPLLSMSVTGESKIPESFVVNIGLSSSTSDKYNFTLPKVPAIKNQFHTRIMYSDININDSFRNGFRTYKLTNYRDYATTYGSIIKLIEWYGNIVAVFEHGAALIPINERTVAGNGSGGNVFINTSNVLPENPKMLSDKYGSLWGESVIKTPYYIYGIDTVAKKIWRTNGLTFEVISDFKVLKFLNDNITLTESEKTPIIGIRNVKTHYNAFKKDVLFTFYDDLNIKEEKVWNLCWNEVQLKFITFYSWVPSYSENIDNIFFSFDRNTSKEVAKLSENYPLLALEGGSLLNQIPESGILGNLKLNLDIENNNVKYEIADKRYANLYSITGNQLKVLGAAALYNTHIIPIKVTLTNSGTETVEGNTINVSRIVIGSLYVTTASEYNDKTTAFWKHGLAGLMNTSIKPTHWYGKLHPFEFECVVVDSPSSHKIFNNLLLISNKAKPESFHYEITGQVYDFANDKLNMYYRLEATKELYLNLGSNLEFNSNYTNLVPKLNSKSTIFPLYYARKKELDKIEDLYELMFDSTRNYSNLSGSEIKWDELTNDFNIAVHKGAYDILEYGRLRGNMNYFEDRWVVEIPSITYMLKNEKWDSKPTIYANWIPNDLEDTSITLEKLPNTYNMGEVSTSGWTYRKETKIRDKYIKIKVRYSGEDLALITALKTFFIISYA